MGPRSDLLQLDHDHVDADTDPPGPVENRLRHASQLRGGHLLLQLLPCFA